MDAGNGSARRDGFTLVEMLIAVAILTIIATMAITSFQRLSEQYKVEAETKQMYANLMEARGRAMQRSRAHFVRISTGGYTTYDDSSPFPDGNGEFNGGLDNQVASVTVQHPINIRLAGGATDFTFDRNGIASPTGYLWFSSAANTDYDCITIRATRIKMGKYNATGPGTCVEK